MTRTDAVNLTTKGELAALLTGRATYRLRREAGRLTLHHRDQWHIGAHPADELIREDVTPEHQCGALWPDELTRPTAFKPPKSQPALQAGEFPF